MIFIIFLFFALDSVVSSSTSSLLSASCSFRQLPGDSTTWGCGEGLSLRLHPHRLGRRGVIPTTATTFAGERASNDCRGIVHWVPQLPQDGKREEEGGGTQRLQERSCSSIFYNKPPFHLCSFSNHTSAPIDSSSSSSSSSDGFRSSPSPSKHGHEAAQEGMRCWFRCVDSVTCTESGCAGWAAGGAPYGAVVEIRENGTNDDDHFFFNLAYDILNWTTTPSSNSSSSTSSSSGVVVCASPTRNLATVMSEKLSGNARCALSILPALAPPFTGYYSQDHTTTDGHETNRDRRDHIIFDMNGDDEFTRQLSPSSFIPPSKFFYTFPFSQPAASSSSSFSSISCVSSFFSCPLLQSCVSSLLCSRVVYLSVPSSVFLHPENVPRLRAAIRLFLIAGEVIKRLFFAMKQNSSKQLSSKLSDFPLLASTLRPQLRVVVTGPRVPDAAETEARFLRALVCLFRQLRCNSYEPQAEEDDGDDQEENTLRSAPDINVNKKQSSTSSSLGGGSDRTKKHGLELEDLFDISFVYSGVGYPSQRPSSSLPSHSSPLEKSFSKYSSLSPASLSSTCRLAVEVTRGLLAALDGRPPEPRVFPFPELLANFSAPPLTSPSSSSFSTSSLTSRLLRRGARARQPTQSPTKTHPAQPLEVWRAEPDLHRVLCAPAAATATQWLRQYWAGSRRIAEIYERFLLHLHFNAPRLAAARNAVRGGFAQDAARTVGVALNAFRGEHGEEHGGSKEEEQKELMTKYLNEFFEAELYDKIVKEVGTLVARQLQLSGDRAMTMLRSALKTLPTQQLQSYLEILISSIMSSFDSASSIILSAVEPAMGCGASRGLLFGCSRAARATAQGAARCARANFAGAAREVVGALLEHAELTNRDKAIGKKKGTSIGGCLRKFVGLKKPVGFSFHYLSPNAFGLSDFRGELVHRGLLSSFGASASEADLRYAARRKGDLLTHQSLPNQQHVIIAEDIPPDVSHLAGSMVAPSG